MKKSIILKVKELTTNKIFEIESAMISFKNAVNDWINISWNNGKITTRKLQQYGYYELREKYPNLYSNCIIEAMDIAIGIVKSCKNNIEKPTFDSYMIAFKNRDYRILSNGVVVPINKRRVFIPLYIPKKFKSYLSKYKTGRLTVIKKNNEYYVTISLNIKPPKRECKNVIGVDIGVYNLVVVADAKGRELLRVLGDETIEHKKMLEYKYSIKQQRASRYSKKCIMGNKYRNYSRYINHCIAKQIVEIAKKYNAIIILEKLKGVKGKSKSLRKLFRKWPYYDLIQKIEYKAKENGIPVVKVSPRNTSKTCSRCGYVNKRLKNERVFVCPKCGLEIDRDLNAAINLAKKISMSDSLNSSPS
jgi:putative transposase